MKNTSPGISIPRPCNESWNNMLPVQKGKFCQSCQKVVVDFTQMSDEQILQYHKAHPGKSCGHYYASQLNRSLEATQPIRRRFLPALLLAPLTTFIFTSTKGFAQTTHETIQLQESGSPVIHIEKTPVEKSDSSYLIRGIILDIKNNPLTGISVVIKGTKTGMITESDGSFKLNVRKTHGEICVQASGIGYETAEYTVPVNNFSNTSELCITLSEVQDVFTGETIILPYHRRSFLILARLKLRHLFSR
ncbi:carboxypeptidase-like regulatory domain-containing protein [Chitinophaga filiformis]|uniref:Carboxypeptidase-like regulatory domain-containing protein n=1 Tax=Chitinophaga filiformis TaxID=104663 RepID=A0ABY4I559_CHIFI|nr:carboxypeptidase-like regulatory domain-containing protein [Chitinophaga filiformis]UPK70783.1 carboxypeptidase-like regulatory domain-containing protein [Chitinophaga filiformis]